jgi:hypothetical protein
MRKGMTSNTYKVLCPPTGDDHSNQVVIATRLTACTSLYRAESWKKHVAKLRAKIQG